MLKPNFAGLTGHTAQALKRPVAWFQRRNPPQEKVKPLPGNHYDMTGGKFTAILAESMANERPE